ncbi:rod shape-determining protein MreC [Nitrosomonas aestuarii]|uniref:rod shape-determining protein MreC n=1 Tax=Nitrosomonas aestuarii TaxID=52441 RepID=UPI000D30D871|nr:rod shape-determining protein MreC [Nitrosomonas aestuarii]PTN12416.1 rod shape-determining protein MreC [Nitrosomonas aestuarii]
MDSTPQFFRHGPGPFARLGFFILLSCLLMAEDLRFKVFPEFRQTIAIMIYPLQKAALFPSATNAIIKQLIGNFHLLEENAYLRERYLRDSEKLLRLRALESENKHLRKLLGAVNTIETKTTAKAVMAEILYTPRDPFSHKITLNKGNLHNIQAGQIVIDNKGIIGQITQVYPLTAEVTLITDKDHSVPIQIVRNNIRTVISGTGKNNEIELRYLSVNTDIREGDLLATSGIGGVYPRGLPVATVSEIKRHPADNFAQITGIPIAGVDRNRQVLILSFSATLPDPSEKLIKESSVEPKNN